MNLVKGKHVIDNTRKKNERKQMKKKIITFTNLRICKFCL